ncbi:MAG: hypothetical protein ACYDHQ_06780 [Coriobacteriia bacterium]
MIRQALERHPEFRRYLFRQGFLITDESVSDTSAHPLYGIWNELSAEGFHFYTHPDQTLHLDESGDATHFLIGHAYDPFDMLHEESEILARMSRAQQTSQAEYIRLLNQLTGVFTVGYATGGALVFATDACGMQSTYFGVVDGHPYVTSSCRILEDLGVPLRESEYVAKLKQYRFYRLLGRALPGDLSPYDEIKRATPNHLFTWRESGFGQGRFFPEAEIAECCAAEYPALVASTADILANNMRLIHRKWARPAISLTGGVDSKTTLACATPVHSEYQYFSYVSSPEERVDAEAAASICADLGVAHAIHEIPVITKDSERSDALGRVLEWNYGGIGRSNANDVLKRDFFIERDLFDVEVKSWVSEVARAYYCKRFAKMSFPERPSARCLTSLYKFFLHDRKLVRDTDAVFERYLNSYYSGDEFDRVWWPDLIFWEYRVPAWNGLVITGEHRIAFDITIPYNNRMLLALMLSAPLEKRISDEFHRDIMRQGNGLIADSSISVTNVKHTKWRALLEHLYLEVHSRLPF